MREPIEFPNLSPENARTRLIQLGVAERFVQSEELDYPLLYERLRFSLSGIYFIEPLLISEQWQLHLLGGLNFNGDDLKNAGSLFDVKGATPIHYIAWSGRPEVLDLIAPEALKLKDNNGLTPIHYAAWSGNPRVLDWIRQQAPECLALEDINESTPIHYAAWSGNPKALDWINTQNSDKLTQKDKIGMTPVHYAAWSGELIALNWIQNYAPSLFQQNDYYGSTPIHFAARSGNPLALDWIKTHYPKSFTPNGEGKTINHYAAWSGNPPALDWIRLQNPDGMMQKDNNNRTPVHYAAWSGNLPAFTWIRQHAQESIEQESKDGLTPAHFAAWSGNPQALIRALLLKKNPETFTLRDTAYKEINKNIYETLLQTLEINYTVTSIEGLNKSSMSEEIKQKITLLLERNNRAIKETKIKFMTFYQGFNQRKSEASKLPPEIYKYILEQMLPAGFDVNRVFEEAVWKADIHVRRIQRKQQILNLIDIEIARLIPSNKEHNKLAGISLNKLYENSDEKIASLQKLKDIVENGDTQMDINILQWEQEHAPILSRHRNLVSRFFSQKNTRSLCFIQVIKNNLNLDSDEFEIECLRK